MVSCLLIDQNDAERRRISALLAQLGIVTSELSDVESGIRFCHDNKPDVVLMEAAALPRSKEFLRLVRYQGQHSGRPVVILYTDHANMELAGESILGGASEFLMTPFDLELLSFKLRQSGILNAAKAA
jgi:DNA-binding NtrC family response regulator